MIPIAPRAKRDVAGLQRHYLQKNRPEAVDSLLAAVREAAARIERDPDAGIDAPRPYPHLRRQGWAWVKARRYWIGYHRHPRLLIAAVFYDAANIPGRF